MRKSKRSDRKQYERRHRARGAGLYHPPEAAERWLRDARELRNEQGLIVAFGPPLVPSMNGLSHVDLDAFGKSAGLKPIGDSWEVVTPAAAACWLARWVTDPVWHEGGSEPDAAASALADRFVRLFGEEALFFTNVTFSLFKNGSARMPLTDATLDAGVVGCDEQLMGLVVASFED